MSTADASYYFAGGTLQADSPSYVERQADRRLLDELLRGEFCYVLTSRQMGKSSLMVRTASKLKGSGIRAVVLDLTAIGKNVSAEQWYNGLLSIVGQQLGLEDELERYWLGHLRLGPCQRFFAAVRTVVLERLAIFSPFRAAGRQHTGKLVVFVDEIDVVRSLPFVTDEFFAALRECYNRRVEDAHFHRLTFCLLGIATPAELIRDARETPFHIGQRIELTDFTPEEAAPLVAGLPGAAPGGAQLFLERILHWTHGHPYLTQSLCRAVVEAYRDRAESSAKPAVAEPSRVEPSALVDQLCTELFLKPHAREQDNNLLYVRERILRADADRAAVLRLYQQIRNRRHVRDDESNPLIDILRLSGISRSEDGVLVVRNRIYHRVFDFEWIQANLPPVELSEVKSIAVLPFADLSADQSAEFLSDGLTEELIRLLGQVAGLLVASRNSVFQFKGKPTDVHEVGERLNVQHVLEGNVRPAGSALEIAVRLFEADQSRCIWSETLRYSPETVLNCPVEIKQAIAAQLRTGLEEGAVRTSLKQTTRNAEAYNLYLKGRFLWNKRTEPDVRRSIGLFERAIKKDLDYAPAYAALADASSILGIYNYIPPKQAFPKAKESATHALELDDSLSEPHCALGCTSAVHDWDWARAEDEFERAIQLNPSNAAAHQWHAIFCLAPLGRHIEALEELRLAQTVDPLSISVSTSVGWALYLAGRFNDAIRHCREALDFDPDFWLTHLFLGWSLLETGAHDDALAAFRASAERGHGDPVPLAATGIALARSGRTQDARQTQDQLSRLALERYVPAMEFAMLHASLGETPLALEWLDRAVEERSFKLIYLKVDPKLASLRSEPRFRAVLERVGLRDEYED